MIEKKDLIIVGGKVYAVCWGCGRLVRLNKPIISSFHVCNSREVNNLDEPMGGSVGASVANKQKITAADS